MPFRLLNYLNNLEKRTGQEVYEQLIGSRDAYDSLSTNVQQSRWLGKLMDDMAEKIGKENAKNIMEDCGQLCIGQSILVKARKLYTESRDIDNFLVKLNQIHIGGGNLRRENDVILASYEKCYCGSVSKTCVPISLVYCQCSCGWYKKLFETALERPVRVELIDSIIHGALKCQFIIHI